MQKRKKKYVHIYLTFLDKVGRRHRSYRVLNLLLNCYALFFSVTSFTHNLDRIRTICQHGKPLRKKKRKNKKKKEREKWVRRLKTEVQVWMEKWRKAKTKRLGLSSISLVTRQSTDPSTRPSIRSTKKNCRTDEPLQSEPY